MGDEGFTSSAKEVVKRIFITLNNPSSSAGFEPTNLWLNGNHANHLTIECDPFGEKFPLSCVGAELETNKKAKAKSAPLNAMETLGGEEV
jgi:hypothetical protein